MHRFHPQIKHQHSQYSFDYLPYSLTFLHSSSLMSPCILTLIVILSKVRPRFRQSLELFRSVLMECCWFLSKAYKQRDDGRSHHIQCGQRQRKSDQKSITSHGTDQYHRVRFRHTVISVIVCISNTCTASCSHNTTDQSTCDQDHSGEIIIDQRGDSLSFEQAECHFSRLHKRCSINGAVCVCEGVEEFSQSLQTIQ